MESNQITHVIVDALTASFFFIIWSTFMVYHASRWEKSILERLPTPEIFYIAELLKKMFLYKNDSKKSAYSKLQKKGHT